MGWSPGAETAWPAPARTGLAGVVVGGVGCCMAVRRGVCEARELIIPVTRPSKLITILRYQPWASRDLATISETRFHPPFVIPPIREDTLKPSVAGFESLSAITAVQSICHVSPIYQMQPGFCLVV